MTKSKSAFGHSKMGIHSSFGFRISSFHWTWTLLPRILLIRQILQILLDLRAVFFRILFVPRLRNRIAIPLRQALILPIIFRIFIRQRGAEASALNAISIAGAAIGIVGPIAFLRLALTLALLALALLLTLAFLSLPLLTLALLTLRRCHFSIQAGLGE